MLEQELEYQPQQQLPEQNQPPLLLQVKREYNVFEEHQPPPMLNIPSGLQILPARPEVSPNKILPTTATTSHQQQQQQQQQQKQQQPKPLHVTPKRLPKGVTVVKATKRHSSITLTTHNAKEPKTDQTTLAQQQQQQQQQGEFANSTIVFGQGPIQSNPKVLKTFVLSPEDFDNEENPQTSSPGEVSDFREVSQPVVWDHRYHATAGKNLIIFFNS